MSTDTMYLNSSRTMASRGRHQQVHLQKPDRRIENQTRLRRQQSTESAGSQNGSQNGSKEQAVMSQFAHSGYGNQEGQKKVATDSVGFVSDDLKRLLSMSEFSRNLSSSSNSSTISASDSHLGTPPGTVHAMPLSPLHGPEGHLAPVVMPPPMVANNIPIPGPHPYAGIPHYQVTSPMAMQMTSLPPQMYQHHGYPQNLVPTSVTNVRINQPVNQHTSQPLQLSQIESQANNFQHIQRENLSTQSPSAVKASKPVRESNSKNNRQNNKKKSSKKNIIPPQQIPVTFSASQSESYKGKSESSHGRSEMKSNGHSKCYAGATFAAEAPQVTSLPKPSFV